MLTHQTGYSMPMSMPTQSYGGYGGYGAPAMDEKVVQTQLDDATKVLTTQFGVQEQMLTHQKDAQLAMLAAEKERALQTMTMQYTQQYTQQHSQLEMAKTQRDMAIQQQAAQMMSQAK